MNKPSCSLSDVENISESARLKTARGAKLDRPVRQNFTACFPIQNSHPGLLADLRSQMSEFKTISLLVLGLALLPAGVFGQSIWRDNSTPMFSDKRGTSVGDIITIVVQENTTTSKDNKTATSKQAAVDASIASFLYSPAASSLLTKAGQMPAMKFSSKNDFSGGGTVANSEKMIARVAVKVVDVLPNKNLVIEGKRETSFSGEKQTIVLRGIVREADVQGNNTVFSYNVADATIQIIGKGQVSDSQRKGWFTRIWDKVSPF